MDVFLNILLICILVFVGFACGCITRNHIFSKAWKERHTNITDAKNDAELQIIDFGDGDTQYIFTASEKIDEYFKNGPEKSFMIIKVLRVNMKP